MRNLLLCCFTAVSCFLNAQSKDIIKLNPPDLTRGLPLMEALSQRASAQEMDTVEIKLQDLSDLLWSANGINRPESGKRTAPSAMNSQDIDIYVFMQKGVYLYNAEDHSLELVVKADHRDAVAGTQQKFAKAPLFCLLVSDISRFVRGEESYKKTLAALDAGIVSQNISLFCASAGLSTRPRAYMDQLKLRDVLNLKDSQLLMLNHPVSYKIN
jgi:SagB-type dehydrogenase family enzyme